VCVVELSGAGRMYHRFPVKEGLLLSCPYIPFFFKKGWAPFHRVSIRVVEASVHQLVWVVLSMGWTQVRVQGASACGGHAYFL